MFLRSLALLLLLFVYSGCGDSSSTDGDNSTTNGTGDDATSDDAIGDDSQADDAKTFEKDGTSAVVATWKETQEYVGKQKGKVVVLDAWSTSCAPCMTEYPHLVALHKKYPERVACVSFNLNYYGVSPPESDSGKILDFLAKQKSALHNVISSTPDEDFYKTVDLGSIPAVFVYGPDGKLKKRFDNDSLEFGEDGFTYEKHIIPLIEELLSEK
jgi:thiol-disulfide isomerase/thioredoxin